MNNLTNKIATASFAIIAVCGSAHAVNNGGGLHGIRPVGHGGKMLVAPSVQRRYDYDERTLRSAGHRLAQVGVPVFRTQLLPAVQRRYDYDERTLRSAGLR